VRHGEDPEDSVTDQQGKGERRASVSRHAAPQRRERLVPFTLAVRLPRSKVDPQRPELRRARRLGRIGVDIHARGDLEAHESGGDDRRLELCFQQSAGDSAFPQIDVALALVTDRLLHEDVADLEPPSRLEDTRHLLQRGELVRKEIENAVRDHHVGRFVRDGQ